MEKVISTENKWEEIQKRKKEIAQKISKKIDVLSKVAKKYAPKKQEAEIDLARDVFYECLEEYQEGEYTWDQFVNELTKSLKALKNA